ATVRPSPVGRPASLRRAAPRPSADPNRSHTLGDASMQLTGGVMMTGPISQFLTRHFRHFNAATLVEAAEAWRRHLDEGGKMLVSMAGAMSTAELGISLAEMIRQDKVHAISCTGANLEEDIFNLVAHDHYERIPDWRELTAQDEAAIRARRLSRVTDTCIPELEAMRLIEEVLLQDWIEADRNGERYFPHEFIYRMLRGGTRYAHYQIDPGASCVLAAEQRNLPIFVPGWEDSTLGNVYASLVIDGEIRNAHPVRTGVEYMVALADWYTPRST